MRTDRPLDRRPQSPSRAHGTSALRRALVRLVPITALVALVVSAVGPGCSGTRPDGLDPDTLPVSIRADYEVFAHRCSQCHSLARPLNAGVDDMDHWRNYVERMRRQQGSHITLEDVPPILRFLEYYTRQWTSRRGSGGAR